MNKNNLIIHIAGPSGSGKTTLGNRLQEIYGNKILVKDTDQLAQEYQNSDIKSVMVYQNYIYKFINNNVSKPIIFVGLVNSATEVLDLKADYKFYIDIPLEQNLKQKFFRAVKYMYEKKDRLFEQYLTNPDKFQQRLFYFVNFDKWKEEIANDNNLYKMYGYNYKNQDEIMHQIENILMKQNGGVIYTKKYLKYKTKYINLKMKQNGGTKKKIILLDGTSSSGKTTISKYFEKNGFKHISMDEYGKQPFLEVMSNLPNEYISIDEKNKLIRDAVYNSMVNESKKYTKVIFDDISQDILNYIERKKIFIIIAYAPLNDLVRNIISRRSTSYRGLQIFDQFTKRYIKTNTIENSIDKINRQTFIIYLKQIKYEFDSEDKLIEFAKNIFNKMNIDDDNDNYIKLRDNYQNDYIINTNGKTPEMMYDELANLS